MLVDSRGYQLTPDVIGSLGRGMKLGTQFANAPLNRQLLEQQVAQGKQAQEINQFKLDQSRAAAQRESGVREQLGQFGKIASQTAQQAQLAEQSADFADVSPQAAAEQPKAMSQDELIRKARSIDPVMANKMLKEMGLDDASKRAEASRFAAKIQLMPYDAQTQEIQARAAILDQQGRDSKDTRQLLNMDAPTRLQALQGVQMLDMSSKERLTIQAKRAKLAAKGAEISEVQSSKILPGGLTQITRKDGTVELKSLTELEKDLVKNAEQRGVDLQGKRAGARQRSKDDAKAANLAFEQTNKLRSNNDSLRKVIDTVKGGAETGPLISKLPSFRAESVKLDQLRNQLGLDVIGSVTFGALSEGELQLALDTALPTGLDGPELIKWAEDKIAAQEKLATYLEDQALFIQGGGSRSEWIKERRSAAKEKAEAPPPPPGAIEDNPK